MYKCPYCVANFGVGGWEEGKKHIRDKHLNGKRRRKSGVVRRERRGSVDFDSVLLEDPEVCYSEEEEELPVLA